VKVFSTFFGDPVEIDEVEAYLSPDGVYRVSIARRTDGYFCIYKRCLGRGWLTDETPLALIYEDQAPQVGIFGTVDDARREIRSYPHIPELILQA